VSNSDSRAASAPFTFWAAPVVSAIAMDQLGLSLAVTFDHASDRAGMASTDQNCSQVSALEATQGQMDGLFSQLP
jgi:hypothetical protein